MGGGKNLVNRESERSEVALEGVPAPYARCSRAKVYSRGGEEGKGGGELVAAAFDALVFSLVLLINLSASSENNK